MPPRAKSTPYLFVAMESSLDWARGSRTRAVALQREGWRCFNNSPEDLTFQYAVERWLIRPDEGYAITDLGKCALSVAVAKDTRLQRYANCAPWLEEEVRALKPRMLIAVGGAAFGHLLRVRSEAWPPVASVLHWSRQNTMNMHRFVRRGLLDGLPSARTLAAWRLRAYDERSWHPDDDPHRRRAANVTDYQLQLLGVYRRQFSAIRAVAGHPTAAGIAAARRVGAGFWAPEPG
jgi:hypothetical protein